MRANRQDHLLGPERKRKPLVTLDDHSARSALNDPAGFVASLGAFAVVDEVQNANIFRAIKASASHRRPGRFLLTGSANVLALPVWATPLPVAWNVTLHPFAQDELANRRSTFIDALSGRTS